MWDNPRLLNSAAGVLTGLAALALAASGLQLLVRSGMFPLHEIIVRGRLAHVSAAQIRTAADETLSGNFFAVDLDALRGRLEAIPWVRRVSLRRVWPDAIEATIEEQVAAARWGEDSLLNADGERFAGHSDERLPTLVGPAGTEGEAWLRFERFSRILSPLGLSIDRLVLTPRYAWQLRLANGLEVVLGRDADGAESRLARFVAAYPATLGRMKQRAEYVDLRYPNGFALRVAAGGG